MATACNAGVVAKSVQRAATRQSGWEGSARCHDEAEGGAVSDLCIVDNELTQSTKAGARESTRANLIEERPQFPQHLPDVATGALRSGH